MDFIDCLQGPIFPETEILEGVIFTKKNVSYKLNGDLITGIFIDDNGNLNIEMKVAEGIDTFREWLIKTGPFEISVSYWNGCYEAYAKRIYFEGTFNPECLSIILPAKAIFKFASYGTINIRHEPKGEETSYVTQV